MTKIIFALVYIAMDNTKVLQNLKLVFALSAGVLFSAFGNLAAQPISAFDTLKNSVSSDISIEFPTPLPKTSHSYLKPTDELYGEKLFQYLHKITLPSKIATSQSGYIAAKSYMYSTADNTICNKKPGLITFYSLVCVNGTSENGYDYKEHGDANGDGTWKDAVNTEHLWPQSYFDEKYPMRADLHHLRPTFTKPNSMRSNYSFAEVPDWDYSTSAGSKRGYNKFEPCDATKGDVARAMLYFMVRYYDKNIRDKINYSDFWINRVTMFLEWNNQDPPDSNEIRRNNLIEKYQGNRNPFTDDPSLADKIGAAVFKSH